MEAGKQVKKLPMTLGDALEALEKDDMIKSAMPGEMHRLYDEYKRDEWERFLHTSTEWDLATYLQLLAVRRDRRHVWDRRNYSPRTPPATSVRK